MDSIVVELQRLASDESHSITDLLRKALLVASKLKLAEFGEWATSELQGYEKGDVPAYRRVRAELKADNPYHGLVPFILPDKMADKLCDIQLRDPIGSLVDLLSNPKRGALIMPFSPDVAATLMEMQDEIGRLYPTRTIARNQIASILDVVRTTVLQWSLKLEQEGILGSGISFSKNEQEIAARTMHVKIENFQGILGDVTGSNVTQNLAMHVQKGDIDALMTALRNSGVSSDDLAELQLDLASEPTPPASGGFGPKVSAWVGKMMSKAASGSWQIAVSAAGKLLGSAIGSYYGLPGA